MPRQQPGEPLGRGDTGRERKMAGIFREKRGNGAGKFLNIDK
jgi:hypothetical protein